MEERREEVCGKRFSELEEISLRTGVQNASHDLNSEKSERVRGQREGRRDLESMTDRSICKPSTTGRSSGWSEEIAALNLSMVAATLKGLIGSKEISS